MNRKKKRKCNEWKRKGIVIAKTVQPDERATFNEVFINARKQLMR